MSDSQTWADAMAMARALTSQEEGARGYYSLILEKYADVGIDGNLVADIKLVTALVTLLSTLIDASAEHFGLTPNELVNFLLLEKFKRDLIDD